MTAEQQPAPAPGADADEGGSPVSESTKSRMAEALARKKAAPGAGAHLDGQAKVGGATENHKATRTFRRKSG